ncbi:hypothetical protein PGT21_029217 [Puccinia graminis f. sp. tritici]|uniref:Uncharacterized protein n=1 Tax=Puccinia graminis f. sp. tritici TaxID=56615 RepID=A0A5B0P5R7_PUCGR|nr:hypothetical protein PGT21_029217 [Puccinia graminis f. sp. tritici]
MIVVERPQDAVDAGTTLQPSTCRPRDPRVTGSHQFSVTQALQSHIVIAAFFMVRRGLQRSSQFEPYSSQDPQTQTSPQNSISAVFSPNPTPHTSCFDHTSHPDLRRGQLLSTFPSTNCHWPAPLEFHTVPSSTLVVFFVKVAHYISPVDFPMTSSLRSLHFLI